MSEFECFLFLGLSPKDECKKFWFVSFSPQVRLSIILSTGLFGIVGRELSLSIDDNHSLHGVASSTSWAVTVIITLGFVPQSIPFG